MMRILCLITACLILSCRSTTYYITRHAEKEIANSMSLDVSLSRAGQQRAEALKARLQDRNIQHIFSTNYNRTLSTVEPLRNSKGLTINLYDTKDTMERFISTLKNINEGNVLIVGHSNTVPQIVNNLMGRTIIEGNLADTAYGDLFIVTKKGKHFTYARSYYGN